MPKDGHVGIPTPSTSGKRPISTAVVKTNAELARLGRSPLEQRLAMHLDAAGIPYVREVEPFFPAKRWRFDFLVGEAKPDKRRVLVECEGQIWKIGAHSSGKGITRDIRKANMCAVHGLILLRFTDEMIKSGEALTIIEQALGGTDANH